MRCFLCVTVATLVLCGFGTAAFANVASTHPRTIATHVRIVLKTAAPTPGPHPTDPHQKNPKNH